MSIEQCIETIINAYKFEYEPSEIHEAKIDLKKIIKTRANVDVDYRTVKGREILRKLKDGLQNGM